MTENIEKKYTPEQERVIREAFKNSGIHGPDGKPPMDFDLETMIHLMVHFGGAKTTLETDNGTSPVQGVMEINSDGIIIKPTQVFKD